MWSLEATGVVVKGAPTSGRFFVRQAVAEGVEFQKLKLAWELAKQCGWKDEVPDRPRPPSSNTYRQPLVS